MVAGLVLGGTILFVLFFIIGSYNKLVGLRNEFKNAFSQIDVQLNRRYDLIPNLVETAKGYLKHEAGTLEKVIAARNDAYNISKIASQNPGDPNAMNKLSGAENILTQALGGLKVTMEAYPDLKSNTTMNQLMEELASTENKVAFARQAYNDSVMSYNTAREVFPANFIANSFNFQEARGFEIESEEARKAVKVSFT